MLTLRIALRNILRQKRRTILTALTMFGGFSLAAIVIAWEDGSYSNIINMFTRNQLGHIQIHDPGYLDRPSLYRTIDDYPAIGEKLESIEGVEAWAPRLYSAGLSSVGEKSTGVRIIGFDPRREDIATRFNNKITAGRTFSDPPAHEAILGLGLAKILKAEIGDTIVIVSQGADGSIANDMYAIVGLAESGDEATDQSAFYLHLLDAQELLVLDNRIHEIVVIVDHLNHVRALTAAIQDNLAGTGLAVEPWQEFAKSFYDAMVADQRGTWILVFIIVSIVGVGVLNTVLMSVLERRREYGLLRALGTPPGQIIRLVVSEATLMAILSIAVGAAISLVAIYLLSLKGIAVSQPITYGGIKFTTMYAEINARSFYIPAITVFCAAFLVSLFPAIKAARTAPARVMRMQ